MSYITKSTYDWTSQTTWYIDPDLGNDFAKGDTALTPIKTIKEWQNRQLSSYALGYRTAVVVDVNLVKAGAWPTGDPFYLTLQVAKSGCIRFKGTKTDASFTGSTGSFTSVTALNRATQTANAVANTNLDATGWSNGITTNRRAFRRRLRLTSGASSGATAWGVKDAVTSKTLRVSPWVVLTTAAAPAVPNFFTPITPGGTDAYIVETLTELPQLTVDLTSHGSLPSNAFAVTFENIQMPLSRYGATTNNYVITRATGFAAIAFLGCDVEHLIHNGGFLSLQGCQVNTTSLYGGLTSVNSCALSSTIFCNPGGNTSIDGDTIRNYDDPSDNTGAEIVWVRGSGLARIGYACSFDSLFGDGVHVDPGGIVHNQSINVAGELLYGSGSTGFGVSVNSGGSYLYATKPTIIGANNSSIGGTTKAWASVPYIETTNNAEIVLIA